MAQFTGTFDEFYQWANARTRFWIKEETQGKRRKVGKCARCTLEGNLTSAHITSLKDVIRKALDVTDDKHQRTWDMDEAWAKIKTAHKQFDKAFQYILSALPQNRRRQAFGFTIGLIASKPSYGCATCARRW